MKSKILIEKNYTIKRNKTRSKKIRGQEKHKLRGEVKFPENKKAS